MSDLVVEGDKILILNEDGSKTPAKCTGITHKNLIHFMYWREDGSPIAGMIGRDSVEKSDS